MQITTTTDLGTPVLHLQGRIDSYTSEALQISVQATLETATSLVLDFSGVEFVSSAALRVVLLAAKETRARGGGFAVCGLREAVRRVFDISGFARVITMAGSEAEAVAAARS